MGGGSTRPSPGGVELVDLPVHGCWTRQLGASRAMAWCGRASRTTGGGRTRRGIPIRVHQSAAWRAGIPEAIGTRGARPEGPEASPSGGPEPSGQRLGGDAPGGPSRPGPEPMTEPPADKTPTRAAADGGQVPRDPGDGGVPLQSPPRSRGEDGEAPPGRGDGGEGSRQPTRPDADEAGGSRRPGAEPGLETPPERTPTRASNEGGMTPPVGGTDRPASAGTEPAGPDSGGGQPRVANRGAQDQRPTRTDTDAQGRQPAGPDVSDDGSRSSRPDTADQGTQSTRPDANDGSRPGEIDESAQGKKPIGADAADEGRQPVRQDEGQPPTKADAASEGDRTAKVDTDDGGNGKHQEETGASRKTEEAAAQQQQESQGQPPQQPPPPSDYESSQQRLQAVRNYLEKNPAEVDHHYMNIEDIRVIKAMNEGSLEPGWSGDIWVTASGSGPAGYIRGMTHVIRIQQQNCVHAREIDAINKVVIDQQGNRIPLSDLTDRVLLTRGKGPEHRANYVDQNGVLRDRIPKDKMERWSESAGRFVPL